MVCDGGRLHLVTEKTIPWTFFFKHISDGDSAAGR